MLQLATRLKLQNRMLIAAAVLLLAASRVFGLPHEAVGSINEPDIAAQTPAQFHQALYNGNDIHREPLKHFPRFMVLIEITLNDGKSSFCTGAALATDVIVTAGHCLADARSIRVKVIRSLNPITYKTIIAKKWKSNPAMNGGFDGPSFAQLRRDNANLFHDIGIIILNEVSKEVEPITIAPSEFNPAVQTLGCSFLAKVATVITE